MKRLPEHESFALDGPTVPFFMYEPELLSSWAECTRSVHRWPFGPYGDSSLA